MRDQVGACRRFDGDEKEGAWLTVKRVAHAVHTPLSLALQIYDSKRDKLVEAAGVEPASEIIVSRETPCLVYSVISLPALRIDKKRRKLVR